MCYFIFCMFSVLYLLANSRLYARDFSPFNWTLPNNPGSVLRGALHIYFLRAPKIGGAPTDGAIKRTCVFFGDFARGFEKYTYFEPVGDRIHCRGFVFYWICFHIIFANKRNYELRFNDHENIFISSIDFQAPILRNRQQPTPFPQPAPRRFLVNDKSKDLTPATIYTLRMFTSGICRGICVLQDVPYFFSLKIDSSPQ